MTSVRNDLDKVLGYSRANEDVASSVQKLVSMTNPLEAAAAFVELGKEVYKERRDVRGAIAIGNAGVDYCLDSAAATGDQATAASLKQFAKVIAYNAAANCWPGWGDVGVDIQDIHVSAGLKLATTSRDLVYELKLGAREAGNAHWLVGALYVAAGCLHEAAIEFARAEEAFERCGEVVSSLMTRGYAALAHKLDPATSEFGAHELVEIVGLLRKDASKAAGFFANQIETADKILVDRWSHNKQI